MAGFIARGSALEATQPRLRDTARGLTNPMRKACRRNGSNRAIAFRIRETVFHSGWAAEGAVHLIFLIVLREKIAGFPAGASPLCEIASRRSAR